MTSKQSGTIKIPPGVVRSGTEADSAGTWYDSNLIRWVQGVVRPIGGWDKYAINHAIASPIRKIIEWTDNDKIVRRALLCDSNVYVEQSGALTEITPTGFVGPEGDFTAGGYGTFTYSYGTYGTPRPDTDTAKSIGPAFSLDNWGEDLVFMSSYDGHLFRWQPSVGGLAIAVPGAPTANRCFVVTPSRHVAIFGLGGQFNKWGWCSQEDIEDWDFASVTNTAGFYEIEPAAPLVAATVVGGTLLFFSTNHAYTGRYLGVPYIFSDDEAIEQGVTPVSHQSIVEHGEGATWPADNGYWTFNGSSISAIPCDLFDFYKGDQNALSIRFRAAAVYLGVYNELFFFYPSGSEAENDSYLSYSYIDKWWSKGKLKRTCGTHGRYTGYPIMGDVDSMYRHEHGSIYSGADLPFIESAAININNGSNMITLSQMLADDGTDGVGVSYTFYGRKRRKLPRAPDEIIVGPLTPTDKGFVNIGATARDWRIRISSSVPNGPMWTFGRPPFWYSARGMA